MTIMVFAALIGIESYFREDKAELFILTTTMIEIQVFVLIPYIIIFFLKKGIFSYQLKLITIIPFILMLIIKIFYNLFLLENNII